MDKFDVMFQGQLVEGADPIKTRKNIATAFHLPPEKVETLFSGNPVALKRDLALEDAEKLQRTLHGMGVSTSLVAQELESEPTVFIPRADNTPQSAAEQTTEPQLAAGPAADEKKGGLMGFFARLFGRK